MNDDIPDELLLDRAIRDARDWSAASQSRHPRWIAVAATFAVSTSQAKKLCRRFGFDPEEIVDRGDARYGERASCGN